MSGASYSYIALLINGLEASLSGYEEMRASYDFKGSVTYVSGYPNWCSRISSITDNLNSGEYFLNICPFFAIKNAPPKSV